MITSRICCMSLLTAMALTAGCASPWRNVSPGANGPTPDGTAPNGLSGARKFPTPQEIVVPGDPPSTSTNRLPSTPAPGSESPNSKSSSPPQPLDPYGTQRPLSQPSTTITPGQKPGEWRAVPDAGTSTNSAAPAHQPGDAPLFRPDPKDVESWKPVEKPLDTILNPLDGANRPLKANDPTSGEVPSNPTQPRLDVPEATISIPGPGPGPDDAGPVSYPKTQGSGALLETNPANAVQLGKTEQGTRILAERFGTEGLRVLLLGSLNGNEADTVKFVESVGSKLRQTPEFVQGRTLLVVPTPNPDGLHEGTLTNARGVNLNRNFPSPRFTTRPTTLTGPYPASEAETQALVETMKSFRPHRVVMVQTGAGERPVLTANARSVEGLRLRATGQELTINHFDNLFKIGSIEEYVSRELKVEMIVINLPLNSAALQDDPSSLLSLVIDGASPEDALESIPPRTEPAESALPVSHDPRSTDLKSPISSDTGKPDGLKGYVTLLPPPPEFADSESDARYFELPPP